MMNYLMRNNLSNENNLSKSQSKSINSNVEIKLSDDCSDDNDYTPKFYNNKAPSFNHEIDLSDMSSNEDFAQNNLEPEKEEIKSLDAYPAIAETGLVYIPQGRAVLKNEKH